MDVAMFGRGVAMFGGAAKVNSTDWPQPSPSYS
jgi:hypothetical protein